MREKRERALFFGLALALVAGCGAICWLLLGRTGGPGPEPLGGSPPGAAVERLVVTRLAGPVRIRRAGGQGEWITAQLGDELHKDDAIETGLTGTAQLAAGESYQVGLDPGARFDVREITAELSRFGLAAGLVSASVREDPRRTVEIESAGGRARTRGADFSVSGSGGLIAVGVQRGEAELSSAGRAVLIRAGQQSMAVKGAPPSPPGPIPSSLLLKVSWPAERVTNQRKLIVSGKTAPGAILAVAGQAVQAGPDGSFRQVIYLREGRQTLTVTGRDVGGHRVETAGPEILLRTHGSAAEFDTQGLWGSGGK